jgi:hypothetical protein
MKQLHPNNVGFFFGGLMAFFHAVWALLVMVGFAQPLLDWIFWLHFLSNPIQVDMFGLTRAIMLVAFTFAVGYVSGWIGASLWNMMHHSHKV